LFFYLLRPHPSSTLFPYTTLFRSTALFRLKPTTILEDATVPRSEIPKMVKAINEIADKYQVTICTFGHAGDGNLHPTCLTDAREDRKSTRLNSSHVSISYAVFCLQ